MGFVASLWSHTKKRKMGQKSKFYAKFSASLIIFI